MIEWKVDDLVTIKADHPPGVESVDVKGEVGIVSEVVIANGRTDVLVHTLTNSNDYGWVFAPEDLDYATVKEIKEKLTYELRKYHAI